LALLLVLKPQHHLLLQRQKQVEIHYAVLLLLWQVQQAAAC
jgi:hypothetical protein